MVDTLDVVLLKGVAETEVLVDALLEVDEIWVYVKLLDVEDVTVCVTVLEVLDVMLWVLEDEVLKDEVVVVLTVVLVPVSL